MNVAIVAPSSIPFVMGGAENLWIALQRFINEETSHDCELFKVPTMEGTLEQVLNSYRNFSALNFDAYDQLITGKYPAWMIKHRNHAIYMLHPLRGLYDTYHFCNLPFECNFQDESWRNLKLQMVALQAGNIELGDFFTSLDALFADEELARKAGLFPGPFAREVIHFLDRLAMNTQRVSLYAAISRTVAQRSNYFPDGAQVEVLYPPPRLTGYRCLGDEYLFTTSRLGGPKRVDLLIEAMRYVKSDIPLLIGGKGPEEEHLRQLAGNTDRIVFLGHLRDDELLEHYARALAVPFVPYDEDYGFITVEAMKSGKPVLTTSDSGGPNEFVVNNETGLVVPPDPIELAKAIDYLCDHRDLAREMGRTARQRVANITWHKVVECLLQEPIGSRTYHQMGIAEHTEPESLSGTERKKMVVAVTFPIYPPRGGGQSRAFNLYREWARYFDITIVSLTEEWEPAFSGNIAPGLFEIRIPKSRRHQSIEKTYSSKVGNVPVTDIIAAKTLHETPAYYEHLKAACSGADIIVACHPYLVSLLRSCAPDVPLWYEAQDVEYLLKKSILPPVQMSEEMLEWVKADEERAWKEAEVVYACTWDDLLSLEKLYGETKALTLEVSNGFAADEVLYTTPALRVALKQVLGLQDQPTVIFMGSWHGPNLEAVERIIQYAECMPAVIFLIVGSAGMKYSEQYRIPNLLFFGAVDEKEKQVLLSAADLAINPITSGSGSNLKIFDYMAAGVPVLTTPFGARGFDAVPGEIYMESEVEDFLFRILTFFVDSNCYDLELMQKSASDLVRSKYSWEKISVDAYHEIRSHSSLIKTQPAVE
jgi:glycosyltransferase involved in cell wall biosynthesis